MITSCAGGPCEALSEHPLLMTPGNVKLTLDADKFETRRLINPQPPAQFPFPRMNGDRVTWSENAPGDFLMWGRNIRCPYGQVGDVLWVREPWRAPKSLNKLSPTKIGKLAVDAGYQHPWCPLQYRADEFVQGSAEELSGFGDGSWGHWRQGMHMPRWACRLMLKVNAIAAERLQDITDEGAQAEGMADVAAYKELWIEINKKRSPWERNDWVWVVKYGRLEID